MIFHFPSTFKQREQVGEPAAGPIVKFEAYGGDRGNEVDARDPCL